MRVTSYAAEVPMPPDGDYMRLRTDLRGTRKLYPEDSDTRIAQLQAHSFRAKATRGAAAQGASPRRTTCRRLAGPTAIFARLSFGEPTLPGCPDGFRGRRGWR